MTVKNIRANRKQKSITLSIKIVPINLFRGIFSTRESAVHLETSPALGTKDS